MDKAVSISPVFEIYVKRVHSTVEYISYSEFIWYEAFHHWIRPCFCKCTKQQQQQQKTIVHGQQGHKLTNSFLAGTLPAWTQPTLELHFMSVIRSHKLRLWVSRSASSAETEKWRKKERTPHLNFTLGQHLSLDRCYCVWVKDLQEREKTLWRKKKRTGGDWYPSSCHFHWLGSGPITQAQLEDEPTHKQTERDW